jgi:hypothetical protein
MADNINIVGTTEGALAAGLEGLPPWATEYTLSSIKGMMSKSVALEASMEKILRLMAKTNMDPKKWQDLNDALDQMLDDFEDTHKEYEKKKKDNKEDRDNHIKGTKLYKLLTDSQYRLDQAVVITTAAFKGMIAVMTTNVKTFDRLYESGFAVSEATDGARDAFDSLRQMSVLAGMSVDKFGKILETSAGANAIGAVKFAKTLPVVSKNLQQFGFDVAQSAQVTGAYLDSMMGFSDVQSKSQEEIEEGASKFGKNLQRLSLITGVSRQKLLEQTAAISQSTDANVLAGTIGEDGALKFSEFIASFKDQNVGQQFLKMMSSKLPALNQTFQNFAKAGLGNLGMQVMRFTKSLAGMSPERAALATKNFVNSLGNLDAVINQQQLLAEAGVEGSEENVKILVGLRQQANATKNLNEADIKKNELAAEQSARIRTAWMGIMGTFSNLFSPTLDELTMLADGLEWVNTSIKGMVQWMTTTTFGDAIGQMLKPFENALSWFKDFKVSDINWSKLFDSIVATIKDAFSSIMNFNFKDTIAKGYNDLIATVSKGFEASVADVTKYMVAFAAAILIATKGLSTVKGIIRILKGGKGAASAAGEAASAGGKGAAGDGLMTKLGKGIGDLGQGIGKALSGLGSGVGGLIKGMLTGLADGLIALGNPKVLLGVVALAGIAGVMWVAGKALQEFINVKWEDMAKAGVTLVALGLAGAAAGAAAPVILLGAAALGAMGAALWVVGQGMQAVGPGITALADGIKAFDQINGANLVQVAAGIAALSGSLVLFGAASAAGGIGNAIGSIAGGFSKLFGDGSIIDQLKMFANIGPALQTGASGLNAITTGLSGLSASLNSFTGLDKMTEIVKTINSIDLLKAAAFGLLGGKLGINAPATKSTEISVPKAPAASTIKSPSAVPADASKANTTPGSGKTDSAQLAGPGIEKPPSGSDINSVLTYQSSLLEQLLIATNTNLSVNKDILKYSKNH